MSKDLAVLGASYFQLPLIKKAKELGYTTHVFAWAADDVGEKEADFFYPISITNKEEILDKCQEIGICGICSIASDLAMITVNHVAYKMSLIANPLSCTKKSTNKYCMRQAFKENNDPSVDSVLVSADTELSNLRFEYPVIVKPTDRSGSRGICKVESEDQLRCAIERAMKESFEKCVLVERYVEGEEFSAECISYNGKHRVLAITKKYTTGAPYFIETGHIEPAPIDHDTETRVKSIVMHALDSLEVKYGASHAEFKINEKGEIIIIEIGCRMGGDCIGSDLVYYSTGIDYVKAVIDISCGNKPDLTPRREKCPAEVRFVLNNDDLMEFERIKKEEPDRIIRIVDDRHLNLIGKTTNSSNRAACYIISSASAMYR